MKTIAAFMALLLFSAAHAQLDKHSWLLGGSGSIYRYHQNSDFNNFQSEERITDINFYPAAGFFIADKFAAGVRGTVGTRHVRTVSPYTSISSLERFGIGPFTRYYLLAKHKTVNIVADLFYQFGRYSNYGFKKGNFNSFSALAGPAFFFNSSVSIEVLAGYDYYKESLLEAKQTQSGIQLSAGIQINL